MPIAKTKTSKKITIKPFSRPPKLPPDFYEKTSQELLSATTSMMLQHKNVAQTPEKPSSSPSLQHCYNSVVNLVSHQFGPRLYQDLVLEFQSSARLILPDSSDTSSSSLLTFLAQQYPKFVDYLLLVRHVFLALDRPYVWKDNSVQKRTTSQDHQAITLLEVGLHQFHQRLLELSWDEDAYQEWWKLLWNGSFLDGGSRHLGLLESTMNMWKDLGVARKKIRQTQPLLESSLEELSSTWQSNTGKYSGEAFLKFVSKQWHYVSEQWTFLPKTWLRTIVEARLLEPHLNDEYLLKELDITNLDHCQRLWFLAARLDDGLKRVLDAVASLVKKIGLAHVTSGTAEISATPKSIISSLLQLHSQIESLQKVVGDIPLKAVWTEIMNHSSLVAEWLAKYVDVEFKNFKSETSLEPLLYLFTHVQAKDVFEAFYKKDLAKRLLLNRVHSMDLERQFVSLLKTECGAGYTSKMEGMFQDVEWSRESLARYKTSPEFLESESGGVDFEVQILTTGYWPVYPQYPSLILPTELTNLQNCFWNHYKSKYQGRKIVWQYALGNCTVKFHLGNKTYEFIVNLCQSLVLTCFNERSSWTMPELKQRIGLEDDEELERTILSMSGGKDQFKILVRKKAKTTNKPVSQIIGPDDLIQINERYSSNLRRIRIPNLLKKETKEERDKVVESVSRDRLYLMDAVLVRILKARKTILHQQLIPQVMEQIKVPAQPSDIKKRIESLIEREYMERDEKDRNRYNYLA
mmetsp:Transcript_7539/g.11498  ORF Transcript_7539/g.11498 Transcript_7539/m.11498 type:complete len:747 (-) Transcript_7539:77-2317(-)|eukprot:CAMPEP_0178902228 /NCGR_PEP_ID=MMETSP0786-20121207/4487_1 /TAXON_ID=186022 /ORGANISM="Thalassionema frauenfeldii, Strain CCMP 1798" /LENGTH=746 /DNA_ID=CAMNT_0020573469 /DNA_START=62 /DNA_END=2302 /DNA_ORIENTATION=-